MQRAHITPEHQEHPVKKPEIKQAGAAKVIPMHFQAPGPNDDLPDPFSPLQRSLLTKDLKAALAKCKTAADMTAASLHVVSIWTARAARLYAWDRVCEVREEMDKQHKSLMAKIEEQERRLDIYQARLELEEARRLRVYEQ